MERRKLFSHAVFYGADGIPILLDLCYNYLQRCALEALIPEIYAIIDCVSMDRLVDVALFSGAAKTADGTPCFLEGIAVT